MLKRFNSLIVVDKVVYITIVQFAIIIQSLRKTAIGLYLLKFTTRKEGFVCPKVKLVDTSSNLTAEVKTEKAFAIN